MKDKATRISEAFERQQEHNTLTTKQKIIKIDLKYGENNGARKERTRLGLKLIKEANDQGIAIPGAGLQNPKKKEKPKPVFVSKAEERKWEYHQKSKKM